MTKLSDKLHELMVGRETEDLEREVNLALHFIYNSPDHDKALLTIIQTVERGIPLAYAIGYTLVKDLPISINDKVLHPGPETITLIESSIAYIKTSGAKTVLDLCTGSGTIAISISKFCEVAVTATDISPAALVVAMENSKRNNARVEFLQGDLFQPVKGLQFDCIIANPPYVRTNDIPNLPRFVKDFAPTIAIDGGSDGLFFHKQILEQGQSYLTERRSLFLECEDNQDREIKNLSAENGWVIQERYPNRFGRIRGFRMTCI